MILGAHVSVAGGITNALENASRVGCDSFQIFTKNQNQWREKEISAPESEKFRDLRKSGPYRTSQLAAHDSYLINLCSPEQEKLQRSRIAFIKEIERCRSIDLDFLIFHPGSHLEKGEEWGLDRIAESLSKAISATEGCTVRLLIETTAGQGTNLGYRFEHLAHLLQTVNRSDRMGVCLDTCHIFAAGYDIRTQTGYENMFREFDQVVGLENLFAFHLNDSKKELGSRVDRHERIGQGELGPAPFQYLCRDKRFKKIPGYLEVPGGDEGYSSDLDQLRRFAAESL